MQENKDNKQGGLSWSTPPTSPTPAQTNIPAQKQFVAPKLPPITLTTQPSQSMKYVGMIVLGIAAGVIIAWGWSVLRPAKEPAQTANTNRGTDTLVTEGLGSGPDFTIASPQSAGSSVVIAKVLVSVPTWIVIYENNDGKPGNALGAGLFFPESQAGTVELLRGTTAGKSYLATEQIDNGDRKFSLKDDPFKSKDGSPQWVTFEVK